MLISLESQCAEVHINVNVSSKGVVSVVSICMQVLIYILIFQSHFTQFQFHSSPIPADSCGFLQEWEGHCKVLMNLSMMDRGQRVLTGG